MTRVVAHETLICVHGILLGQGHIHGLPSLATLASTAKSSRGSKSIWPAGPRMFAACPFENVFADPLLLKKKKKVEH